MKKTTQLLMVLLALVFFSACEYEFIEPKQPDIDPTDTLSFKSDIIPIFQEDGCTGCHSTVSTAFSLEEGNAYQNIQDMGLVDIDDPESSKLYYVPNPASSVSHTKYSTNNAAKVLLWIQQGAENN